MNEYPTVQEVREALRVQTEDYRRRMLDLRRQLRDEGKDAIDPGHSAGADSIKFNIACIEQLLSTLPSEKSVQRVVVCGDPETGENTAFAVVTGGRGGVSVQVGNINVQTLSCDAPAVASLLDCCPGDDTPLGCIVAVDRDEHRRDILS
ncbi:MAG: hypothetical protein NT018_08875 [Armatimonadetes bacterium]|nr:hypothetical protein [Armatimonadota bacterium]